MNYYRNIDRNKIQFDFVNIYDKELCFQKEINELGGIVYKTSNYYRKPIKFIFEIVKIIKENNYKIVHCNMNSAVMLYPIIAAKIAKAKVIIAHSHNSSSDKGIVKTILHNINKFFIPLFANTFFACSDAAGKWFYSKRIRKSNDYYIINNAIDTKKFAFDGNIRIKLRKEFNILDDELVIGHVGRFNKQKNHQFIIDVFYNFHLKNKKSKLVLIGNGPLKDKIKEKVETLKLNDSVLFLENRNDVNQLMQMMDVFLLPSLYEGLPLVGVEAQASGLKCFFSDSITREVKLLDSTSYLSLNEKSSNWSGKIMAFNDKITREIAYKKIEELGFDIYQASNKLVKIYIKRR